MTDKFQIRETLDKAEEILTHPPFKVKKRRWLGRVVLVLGVLLTFILIIIIPVLIQGTQIAKSVFQAQKHVSDLAGSLAVSDFVDAQTNLADLKNEAVNVKQRLNRLGPILLWPSVKMTAKVSDQMLGSTISLMTGYDRILGVLVAVQADLEQQSLTVGFTTADQKKAVLKSLNNNHQVFEQIELDIRQAEADLLSVKTNELTSFLQDQLILFSQSLEQAISNTEVALPIVANLPELAGYQDEKIYLFLFQNNMELRATGGFIGSYGLVRIEDGEIQDIFTDDIYNLDKHAIGKIDTLPPEPMQKYLGVDTWYLRDANWSPDWETSVEQILWFFNQERQHAGLEPIALDGVIAITPDFIANLLAVTGPVMADGIQFEEKNFAQDLEQFVEQDYVKYGIPRSQRKAIIGSLTDILVDRLHQLPPHELIKVWLAFKQNIEEKNILVYLLDPELQQYFANRNWAGEVKQVQGDYLMVVDSNMAALKTDSVMERDIAYNLRQDESGDLIAQLEITYHHTGKIIPGFISRYQTYVRIYVPENTWFLRASLEGEGVIKNLDILQDWDMGQELGKRYGATFLTVEPGKSKTLRVEYRLPDSLKQQLESKRYTLLVQKQPGTSGHDLNIGLDFKQPIRSYHAYDVSQDYVSRHISWHTDLSVDREYLVNF